MKSDKGETTKYAYEPTRVNLGDRKAIKVYAGYGHCMVITNSDVLVWGSGNMGQLGVAKDYAHEPVVIDELAGKNVKKG